MAVDKSPERVRSMFGEIAGRYDLMNHVLSLNVDRYWRWRTVRSVGRELDGPVLDLCTGTGDLALAFWRSAPQSASVVGADFCRPMLVLGRDKSAKAGANGQVRFVEADACRLPFPDNSFQVVSVAFGLRNVVDTDLGLREMVRVCRPGGRVAVLEASLPNARPLRVVYGWYFRHVLPRLGQLLARNRHDAYNYLPDSVGEFPSGEALLERMRAAGLSTARHHSLTFGLAALYIGGK